MSATDELRRLLDERGVEWAPSAWDAQHETFYSVENGVGFIVTEFPEIGRMSLACDMRITPAQAIDATLGSSNCTDGERMNGTCHETVIDHYWRGCGSCGYIWEFMYGIGKCERPRYCPNCGRKVVE